MRETESVDKKTNSDRLVGHPRENREDAPPETALALRPGHSVPVVPGDLAEQALDTGLGVAGERPLAAYLLLRGAGLVVSGTVTVPVPPPRRITYAEYRLPVISGLVGLVYERMHSDYLAAL
jgi:hypothetical protein